MSECTCFEVPPQYWTTHYGAVEPGSTLEPNPECLEHFPETAPRHRLVLSVAAAEHELETVATLMESIGRVNESRDALLSYALGQRATPPWWGRGVVVEELS
jgi:hypothetical protein